MILRLNETYEDQLLDTTTINDPKQTVFNLEKMWNLDQLGIQEHELDNESKLAISQFENSVRYSEENQQYVVRLPWKHSSVNLANNYGLALGRLTSLRSKLLADLEKCKAYDEVLRTTRLH